MTTFSRIVLFVLILAMAAGGVFSLLESRGDRSGEGAAGTSLRAVLYTNPGATTPQIPLWAAFREGGLETVFDLDVKEWRSAGQLQSLLLAGKGDIWVGHVDGFARARHLGAPVVLVAVTGWRKMSIVSTDPAVSGVDSFLGGVLPFAPVGSPAVTILEALLGDRGGEIRFDPHEPKQLALKMVRGDAESALLPEPLVTVLLGKIKSLRVVCNLEDLYATLSGGKARMPLAGIAVHERLTTAEPERVSALLSMMKTAAAQLERTPEKAPEMLPEAYAEFVPRDVVRASLARDLILVEGAWEVREEVVRYLSVVAPELGLEAGMTAEFEDAFFWRGNE